MGPDQAPVPPARHGDAVNRQRGIALITAVLVTALVAVTAVAMLSEQQLDIRRTENVLDRAQALQFALGMESAALQLLRNDAERNGTDHRAEEWNQPRQYPAPGGAEEDLIGVQITDLQGRFNLNNLVDRDGAIVPAQLDQLRRLLTQLELPAALADRIADWMDADSTPHGVDGAEDGEYTRLDPPYRTGNMPLASPGELLLIMSREEYRKLADHVAVLPGAERTKINLNTASREVLASLEYLSGEEVSELLAAREQLEKQNNRGFDKIREVLELPGFRELRQEHADFEQYMNENCGVASDYFLATMFARFDKGEVVLRSLIRRTRSGSEKAHRARVLMRIQGDY